MGTSAAGLMLSFSCATFSLGDFKKESASALRFAHFFCNITVSSQA